MYINSQGEFPRYIGDIRIDNPGWQRGDSLPEGWHQVIQTEPPAINKFEVLENGQPELRDGIYYQTWNVRPMTEEEIDRVTAPERAKQKLIDLGFTENEIQALRRAL